MWIGAWAGFGWGWAAFIPALAALGLQPCARIENMLETLAAAVDTAGEQPG